MAEEIAAMAQVLDKLLHPRIPLQYRIELIVLGSLNVLTTLFYLITFAHEVYVKRSWWFFRISRDNNDSRYLVPNALLLWLPLASIYSILSAAAAFFRAHNDYYETGTQSNLLILALIPFISLGCAGWFAFTSVLVSSIQIMTSGRNASSGFKWRMPNTYIYHFFVFVVPFGLFSSSLVMCVVANKHYNSGTATADLALATDLVVDCVYLATSEITLQCLLFVPAAVVIFLSVRKSVMLRNRSVSGSGSDSLIKLQKLLVVFMTYSCSWVLAAACYYYVLIYNMHAGSGPNYRRDTLVNAYLFDTGCAVAAVFLLIRTFVAKDDLSISNASASRSGIKSNYKTSFATKSREVPLQLHVLTRTDVTQSESDPKYYNETPLDYEKEEADLAVHDVPFTHNRA